MASFSLRCIALDLCAVDSQPQMDSSRKWVLKMDAINLKLQEEEEILFSLYFAVYNIMEKKALFNLCEPEPLRDLRGHPDHPIQEMMGKFLKRLLFSGKSLARQDLKKI